MIILLNKNDKDNESSILYSAASNGIRIVNVDVDDLTLNLLVDMYIKDEK